MIRKCRHYKVFWWYRGDGTDTTHFATAINFTNVNIPPIQKNHGISVFFRGILCADHAICDLVFIV